jgi:hypothetical protein
LPAQTVDHYDMSRVGTRGADGQAAYPAGVNDPSRANPPSPPTEVAIPPPPAPDSPLRSMPSGFAVPPVGSTSEPLSKYPAGPGGQSYLQASPPCVQGPPPYGSPGQVYSPNYATENPVGPPASWYTRIDYFHWNERIAGQDFVNESGALFTLGYQRRIGYERFRAELFGGDVHYNGYGQFDDGSLESLPSNTGYLGLRGEYELMLSPDVWQGGLTFMVGVGSRFWIRDLHDGTTDAGNPVFGYEEKWWTIYPYLGVQTNTDFYNGLTMYTESRIGMTAVTYDFASIGERPLWPRPGVMGNLEVGMRGQRYFAAARAEVMSWEQSSTVQDAFQPHSIMYTVGGRLGVMF